MGSDNRLSVFTPTDTIQVRVHELQLYDRVKFMCRDYTVFKKTKKKFHFKCDSGRVQFAITKGTKSQEKIERYL